MKKFYSALLLAAAFVLAPFTSASAAGGYDEITPAFNTSSGDKVEVIEFFWLGCPHCYSFDPAIESWRETKPDHAAFVREAPPLNPAWESHSRGFYAAQVLGIEDEFVQAMFDAIHGPNKKGNMRKPAAIAKLAATLGVDEKKFLGAMNSFAVNTKLNRSIELAQAAKITGVPAIVVNGKYLTSVSRAGSNAGVIQVINDLVEKENNK